MENSRAVYPLLVNALRNALNTKLFHPSFVGEFAI